MAVFETSTAIGEGSPYARGNSLNQHAPQRKCGTCLKGFHPANGHGPASPTDPRRILTVDIDASWKSFFGNVNERISNATTCAIDLWNNAVDPYGNRTAYFFKLDLERQFGNTPDVTIFSGACSSGGGGAGYGCSKFQPYDQDGNDIWSPSRLILSPNNVVLGGPRDSDICGRIAHELGHKLGIMNAGLCYPSVMIGTNQDGHRADENNRVNADDVNMANEAYSKPESCLGDPNSPVYQWSEPKNPVGPQSRPVPILLVDSKRYKAMQAGREGPMAEISGAKFKWGTTCEAR